MPESALAVANTFIEIAEEKGQKLTPLKLLKLVYFAHGWYLAITGKPLINEAVEAWKFGPVVPSLYRAFREYREKPIEDKEYTIQYKTRTFEAPVIPKGDPNNIRVFLEKIWDVYGKLGAGQLSNLTHESSSPWYQIWENGGGKDRKGTDIPDELIKSYFEKKLKKRPATTEQASGTH
jgi:uncharacterized phage-associated protein